MVRGGAIHVLPNEEYNVIFKLSSYRIFPRIVRSLHVIHSNLFTRSTIFSELMESMSPWYMSTALEADFYKARAQSKRKMAHDPRTNKPFEDKDDFSPVRELTLYVL